MNDRLPSQKSKATGIEICAVAVVECTHPIAAPACPRRKLMPLRLQKLERMNPAKSLFENITRLNNVQVANLDCRLYNLFRNNVNTAKI